MPYPWSLQEPPPEVTPNPYVEPTEFTAGDTFLLRKASNLYRPVDGWAMAYALRGGGGTKIDLTSTIGTNGDYLLSASATSTASWAPGDYTLTGFAINAGIGERYQVFEGSVTIFSNMPQLGAAQDLRSHARRVLDSIEAVIEGRASNDILTSTIDNTSFGRLTPEQLTQMHSYYTAKVRSEVAKARVRAGLGSGRNILTRFTSPV